MYRTRLQTLAIVLLATLGLLMASPARAVRVKDVCDIEGVRSNQLVGYGLVVGLDGTGDDTGTEFTVQSLVSFLRRNNIQVDPTQVEIENVAAVMVTATLPPFARQGQRIDVVVSSIGDAEDLKGGTLIATPLRPISDSGNGRVYAVAQGPISTGGFSAEQSGASVVKNHPTVATIPGGAMVEAEVANAFATKSEINFLLKNPDFTTARRIAQIVNATVGEGMAQARNAAVVAVRMPSGDTDSRVRFVAELETLEISPDTPARVVYNERTGTIVMGSNVRISKAIITHGNLVFEKEENRSTFVNQATDLETGMQSTTLVENVEPTVRATEERGEFQVMEEGVTIGEVAKGLNALGVTSRDIIAILQALKECGALQAELVGM